MEKDLNLFRLYLQRNGRARRTIETKYDLIKRLITHIKPLDQNGVEKYLFSLYDQGRSAKYLNTYLDALRVYQRYLNEELWEIPYFKEKETFRTLLTKNEIQDILNCPPPNNGEKMQKRHSVWTLFFAITAYGGFRPGEVANLTVNDIDFQENTIMVRESKIGEFRIVPISPKIREDMYQYIKSLNSHQLFPSISGSGVVDDVDWGYNFMTRLKKCGIKKKGVSVYSLRFSFITRMLSEDVNLFKVQRIVGHHRVEQTAHYTRYVIKDLARAIEHDSLAKEGITPSIIIGWILRFITKLIDKDDRFKKTITQDNNSVKIEISYK